MIPTTTITNKMSTTPCWRQKWCIRRQQRKNYDAQNDDNTKYSKEDQKQVKGRFTLRLQGRIDKQQAPRTTDCKGQAGLKYFIHCYILWLRTTNDDLGTKKSTKRMTQHSVTRLGLAFWGRRKFCITFANSSKSRPQIIIESRIAVITKHIVEERSRDDKSAKRRCIEGKRFYILTFLCFSIGQGAMLVMLGICCREQHVRGV